MGTLALYAVGLKLHLKLGTSGETGRGKWLEVYTDWWCKILFVNSREGTELLVTVFRFSCDCRADHLSKPPHPLSSILQFHFSHLTTRRLSNIPLI
ncbi:hypothetical protein RRG08_002153 [Elysia crispata]|uniref:Uncharacterized protein n=1 Tax=Elysia crispata TaxID=231223 RepID=A0AAE0ZAN9_9GAST|nr:hypothetical protein RRG08_002153 [Elysia crispata]